ncbi:ABC transporter ATP-binding protein [Corynebacterium aquilae]|uniref:ABC transporter domain-containing protein n=1 Tax=Corynebacterium aquilae DSM 44791 TaxID=1431546 RepID=A0A1L7CID6_9CORY|nr:ABC transporter ATP-binding protein [Corynebacterium aquilae]APT85620.1 hypothetical protein CAQU_11870 [Corynebacterium aquilae DSM 44791]
MTPLLQTKDLCVGYGDRAVVQDVSVVFPAGCVTAVVGPNGSGKSTLLRAMCRLLPVRRGVVEVAGREVSGFGAREFARMVALLPQHPVAPEGISVRELVARGRYPHQGFLHSPSAEDREVVQWALEATSVAGFADRMCSSLSGGQRQRVWMAMVLAQRTPIVCLDEPTTYLDMAHQIELLDLVRDLARERQLTVVAVLHELNLAARCAEQVVTIKDGRVAACGAPAEVFTPGLCREIFDLDAVVIDDPAVGHPLVAGRGRLVEGV